MSSESQVLEADAEARLRAVRLAIAVVDDALVVAIGKDVHGRAAMLGRTALGGYGLDVVPRDQRWHGGQAVTPAMLAALAGSGKGPGGGLNVEHLEVRAGARSARLRTSS